MARPVQVDRDKGLEKAESLFWSHGYTATSLSELLEVTSMGRGSFYAAYGSKQKLFEAVLERYQRDSAALIAQIDAAYDGLGGARRVRATNLSRPVRSTSVDVAAAFW